MVFTELSSLLPSASPGALRFSQCRAPGTAPRGLGRAPGPGTGGAGGCQQGREPLPLSHCNQTLLMKCLGSSKLALSYGKMSLEALQPPLLQGVSDNPAASQIPWDHPSSSPLQKDFEIPSSPCLAFQCLPFLKRNSCAARRFYHFVLRIS